MPFCHYDCNYSVIIYRSIILINIVFVHGRSETIDGQTQENDSAFPILLHSINVAISSLIVAFEKFYFFFIIQLFIIIIYYYYIIIIIYLLLLFYYNIIIIFSLRLFFSIIIILIHYYINHYYYFIIYYYYYYYYVQCILLSFCAFHRQSISVQAKLRNERLCAFSSARCEAE